MIKKAGILILIMVLAVPMVVMACRCCGAAEDAASLVGPAIQRTMTCCQTIDQTRAHPTAIEINSLQVSSGNILILHLAATKHTGNVSVTQPLVSETDPSPPFLSYGPLTQTLQVLRL